MEEMMIFSALQTLNEEAQEDILEEQAKMQVRRQSSQIIKEDKENTRMIEEAPANFLYSPVEDAHSADEIDVVYLKSSPLLSHRVVACQADNEVHSTAPSVESNFSPYKGSISISRTSSLKGGSVNVSPKHYPSKEQNLTHKDLVQKSVSNESKSKSHDERPSSLLLSQDNKDNSNYVINVASDAEDDGLFFMEDDIRLTSLYGSSPSLVNGIRSRSLSEHLSTSSPSLEKLRKLTRKLHSVFGSQDGSSQQDIPDVRDTEISPLVSLSSSRASSIKRKSKPCSKVVFDESSLKGSSSPSIGKRKKDEL